MKPDFVLRVDNCGYYNIWEIYNKVLLRPVQNLYYINYASTHSGKSIVEAFNLVHEIVDYGNINCEGKIIKIRDIYYRLVINTDPAFAPKHSQSYSQLYNLEPV